MVIVADWSWTARQRTNTENSKQTIPRKGIARPHSCVFARLLNSHDCELQEIADRSWEYINRSPTHECGNLD